MSNIIFMQPVYKDYIWGGKKLKEELSKNSPYCDTAESWEIAANKNGNCRILNKEYENKTLMDLFNDIRIKKDIFGTKCEEIEKFPLLIKFIDAKEDLSIQVHPDKQHALRIGETNGKNEMWYIMSCNEDSQIIAGLNKKVEEKELKSAMQNEKIKDYLNYIDVTEGDSIYIVAGMLHAILKNNLICEIQQNCDITYRVYDWDRVDKNGKSRELNKKEAMENIKVDTNPIINHSNVKKTIQNLVKNEYFITDKINCMKNFKDKSNRKSFYAINVVKGSGIIKSNGEEKRIKRGDSFIIPATLGNYEVIGKVEMLKSYLG